MDELVAQSLVSDLEAGGEALDARFRIAKERGLHIRYLAEITPVGARVGLVEVAASDPFASLSGPENMFVIRTKRYDRYPLIIRGPGAGAEVTAAGVFGDILRLTHETCFTSYDVKQVIT
jgi:aspartokinase/homoserine dehydrogenase 1